MQQSRLNPHSKPQDNDGKARSVPGAYNSEDVSLQEGFSLLSCNDRHGWRAELHPAVHGNALIAPAVKEFGQSWDSSTRECPS
jgi:hypothetical protein